MVYKASLDLLSKLITLFCLALFTYVGFKAFTSPSVSLAGANNLLVRIGIVLLLTVVIIVCYLLSTRSYTLTADRIVVNRPFKSFFINVADIASVQLPSSEQFAGLVRTFGVGGMFGYYGKYYNSSLGRINLYTTQRRNRILIVTKDKTRIVISPDDASMYQKLTSMVNGLS